MREVVERLLGERFSSVEIDPEMTVLAAGKVPEDVVALVTSFEADEYVDGSFREWEHQLLYGAWGFEETNGEDGIVSESIDSGGLPEGALAIGEHLLVDSLGTFPLAIEGAVYAVSDYWLREDGSDKIADSVLELLRLIEAESRTAEAAPAPVPQAPAAPAMPRAEPEPPSGASWSPTTIQICTVDGVTVAVDVPTAFVVEPDATGFVARSAAGSESVAVTVLPESTDVEVELKMGALFDDGARVERDDLGGLVTTTTSATRVMRAGSRLVRCYVKGGSPEDRVAACKSLRSPPPQRTGSS